MSIVVVEPGFSSVQDLGRAGLASSGVPSGGAYDEWALRAANRLCGNDDSAATIEFAVRAPSLRFTSDAVVALTGARYERSAGGAEVPHATSFVVRAKQTLVIGRAHGGLRGYIGVRGGIATPSILGSRSASPRAGIGAMLTAGVTLPVGEAAAVSTMRRMIHAPESLDDAVVRAIAGPQDDAFTADSLAAFFDQPYVVSPESDRVGMRLDGIRLTHLGSAGIDPEGVVPGAVQVPGDGRPIVLGPDGPATGGYAKIAVVCSADLCVLGQARPGATLRFERVTVEQARQARLTREHALAEAIADV